MTAFYLGLEAAAYITFLICDFKGGLGHIADPLKMGAISLVFVYTLYRLLKRDRAALGVSDDRPSGTALQKALKRVSSPGVLLCLAMFFTVSADTFLLFGGSVTAGVVCFCVTQSFHMARLLALAANDAAGHSKTGANQTAGMGHTGKTGAEAKSPAAFLTAYLTPSNPITRLCMRLSAAGVFFAVLSVAIGYRDADLFVLIFYAISFTDNICLSVKLYVSARKGRQPAPAKARLYAGRRSAGTSSFLLMTGLILFFLCDINVALYNAASFAPGTIPEGAVTALSAIRPVTGILMWFFYLPGQVLISLS